MNRKRGIQNGTADDLSIRQKAYLYIQRCIASGQLKAGNPISEVELARELGSSRTPVREAVGQLVAEGLLEQSRTGGTLVTQLKREDIIDLYELREALEVFVVMKLVRLGIRAEDSARLQKLVDELLGLKRELESSGAEFLNVEQMNRFIACDFSFHAMLISLAQNARMQKVINDTRLLIRIFACYRHGHDATLLQQVHQEHQDLLNAVVERDRDRAVQLISEHVGTSQRERLEDFDMGKREESIRASIPSFLDIQGTFVGK